MQTENLIDLNEFCKHHKVEFSFINSLQQIGLIEIQTIKETWFIDADHLYKLERMVRFYYELDINIEGIETITHLLNQIQTMQDEIIMLKNALSIYT